jgi:hypothetical protein
MESLPADILSFIIYNHPSRSRIVGLSCRALKPYSRIAVLDTRGLRLERAAAEMERDIRVIQMSESDIQEENVALDTHDLFTELCALRVRYFPDEPPLRMAKGVTHPGIVDVAHPMIVEDMPGRPAKEHVTSFTYKCGPNSTHRYVGVVINANYALGPAGMMREPHVGNGRPHYLNVRMYGTDRSRGTLCLSGVKADGTRVDTHVCYRNGLMGGVLKAVGFY